MYIKFKLSFLSGCTIFYFLPYTFSGIRRALFCFIFHFIITVHSLLNITSFNKKWKFIAISTSGILLELHKFKRGYRSGVVIGVILSGHLRSVEELTWNVTEFAIDNYCKWKNSWLRASLYISNTSCNLSMLEYGVPIRLVHSVKSPDNIFAYNFSMTLALKISGASAWGTCTKVMTNLHFEGHHSPGKARENKATATIPRHWKSSCEPLLTTWPAMHKYLIYLQLKTENLNFVQTLLIFRW